MKIFSTLLVLILAATIATESAAQEKDAKKDEAKPAAKAKEKPVEKPAAKTEEKPGEKPAETSGDPMERFAQAYKKWNEVDTKLNDLSRQYQLAPSSEERGVLRERYQKLVTESEKLLPELRAAAEAAFAAAPGKEQEVTKILMGMMAYDYRRDDYDAVLKNAQKLVDAKVEDPALYAIAGVAAFRANDYDTAEKYLPIAEKADKLDAEGKQCLADLPKEKELWAKEQAVRTKEQEAGDLPRVKLETSKGTIVIELLENEAPQTVGNFVNLVETKSYDGKTFHRVLSGFMAQGGDPTGDGTGGPGYQIPCECYREDHRLHFRGTLSMAHAGKDTGGSQFFLTFRRTPHLDGKHTVFGRVVEGMEVLAKLQRRNPEARTPPEPDKIVTASVLRKREHEYQPTKVAPVPEPGKTQPGKNVPGKAKDGKSEGK